MGFISRLSLVFAAGTFGALANSLALWALGQGGVTAALGVAIAPALTPEYLYPRLVWGGLWGLPFLLPWKRGKVLEPGFVYSLGPTLVQLLVVFPFKAGKGWLGLSLGALTPVLVVLVNAIWGWAAALWLKTSRG